MFKLVVSAVMALGTFSSTLVHASAVSTSVEFTAFTMGGFTNVAGTTISPQLANGRGLSVNGVNVDLCHGDPACAATYANPSSITGPLSGSSVVFGYANLATYPSSFVNSFSFEGAEVDIQGTGAGNIFKLGSFTYRNGGMYPLMFLDFVATTHSADAAYGGHQFHGRIRLDVNSATQSTAPCPPDDPSDFICPPQQGAPGYLAYIEQDADYFSISDDSGSALGSLGSVRVYEYGSCPVGSSLAPACNEGTVDLFGHINSLHFDKFANPTGGAFISKSLTGDVGPVGAVDEPGSMLLAGVAVVGLLCCPSARRKSPNS